MQQRRAASASLGTAERSVPSQACDAWLADPVGGAQHPRDTLSLHNGRVCSRTSRVNRLKGLLIVRHLSVSARLATTRLPNVTRRGWALSAMVLVMTPGLALAAASMSAPGTAKVGSRVKITASGLSPGPYNLVLAIQALPGGASPTNCVGAVGSARAHAGRVAIAGRLPKRLGCYSGVGPNEGYVTVGPGRKYHLTLCLGHPNGCRARGRPHSPDHSHQIKGGATSSNTHRPTAVIGH